MFKEQALKAVTLKNAKLAGLFTPRYAEPVATGHGYLYFFPLGQTEPAVVHLTDEDGQTFYSLLVAPAERQGEGAGRLRRPPGRAAVRRRGQRDRERTRDEARECLRSGGFSLLEVMVALAILAMALVVLVRITTNNVRNTQHAKMTTTATFLARAKMAELEDVVLEEGFVDNDQEEEGDFSDNEQPEVPLEDADREGRAAHRPGPADAGRGARARWRPTATTRWRRWPGSWAAS